MTDEFDPRRADGKEGRPGPGATFEYTDPAGDQHTLRADDDGVVRPANALEARIADSYGLPVARSAKSDKE